MTRLSMQFCDGGVNLEQFTKDRIKVPNAKSKPDLH